MKKIVIASKNPVKVKATLDGFQKMFPGEDFEIETVLAPSEVSDQPSSDEEALQGASNRARNASQIVAADYWVGIEGGIQEMFGKGGQRPPEHRDREMAAFAWIVIVSKNLVGKGRTGAFFLPSRVADYIRQGKELGEADDIVFNRSNSKQDNGAIGILTDNVVDRAQLYEQAVILALVPFKNTDLYNHGNPDHREPKR